MGSAQRKAVQSHRARLSQRGVVRAEVLVPAGDVSLLRALAVALRDSGSDRVRTAVRKALQPPVPETSIVAQLASDLPDEPFETLIDRPRDRGRDVAL
jgi:hypothetical protein